jgi:hypothetical protein
MSTGSDEAPGRDDHESRSVPCASLFMGGLPMRCSTLLAGGLFLLVGASSGIAQTSKDTLPVSVVERMFDAFNRGDQAARSRLYDTVYFFQDLAVPAPGDARRPKPMSAEERARKWQASMTEARFDTLPRRSRRILERMAAGRFVVYHVAVLFESPHQDQSFEKLEVYEVKNGKIVAEYDGQYTASGRPRAAPDR